MVVNVLVDRLKRYIALEGIFILVLSDFLFVLGTGIWSPYLNIYFNSIGLTAFYIGLSTTLQSAVSSLTMIPGGIVSDRIGRKKPIIVSYILTLIYTLGLIVVRDYQLILIITCIQGVAIGLRTPAISAYVIDVVREKRGAAFSAFNFFALMATMFGTAVGAPITEGFSYQVALQVGAIIVLSAGGFTFFRLKESMSQTAGYGTSMTQSLKDGVGLMRDTNILLLVAGCVVHQVATSFALPYLSLYLNVVLLFDLILVGVLLNARQIGDIFGQLPSGLLIDRVGAEMVLFLHVLLTAPVVYFFGTSSNPYLLFIILLIWGSEVGWDIPSRRVLISKYSRGVGAATALGAVQSFIGLIALLSPTIGGWMWDNLGSTFMFQMSALVNVVACIPLAVLMRKTRREKRASVNAVG